MRDHTAADTQIGERLLSDRGEWREVIGVVNAHDYIRAMSGDSSDSPPEAGASEDATSTGRTR